MQAVQDIQIGARVSRTQYQYTLMDTDPVELAEWLPKLVGKLRGLPELQDVTSDQQNSGFATEIIVDRDAATRLGVTMQSIEDVLYDAFGQRQISTIFSQSNQYRVVMEADPSWVADPGSLARLRIPGTIASIGANGAAATASTTVSTTNTVAQVPLSAVARIERRTAPLVITHQAQFPSATISFNLRPGV
jgi:multidrug efflux pump